MSDLKELDHSKILTYRELKDKNVSLQIGVFNGSCQLSVWGIQHGGRGPAIKHTLPFDLRETFIFMAKRLLSAGAGKRWSGNFQEWQKDAQGMGKNVPTNTVVWGVDDRDVPYIGIKSTFGTFQFPIRLGLRMDLSSAEVDKREQNNIAIDAMIRAFTTDIPQAIRLTCFKRDKNAGGGYNNGGQNRNGNSGGGYDRGNGGGSGQSHSYKGGNNGGGSSSDDLDDADITSF